jgi:hypothetical protein
MLTNCIREIGARLMMIKKRKRRIPGLVELVRIVSFGRPSLVSYGRMQARSVRMLLKSPSMSGLSSQAGGSNACNAQIREAPKC